MQLLQTSICTRGLISESVVHSQRLQLSQHRQTPALWPLHAAVWRGDAGWHPKAADGPAPAKLPSSLPTQQAAPEGCVGGTPCYCPQLGGVTPHRGHREAVGARHLDFHYVVLLQPGGQDGEQTWLRAGRRWGVALLRSFVRERSYAVSETISPITPLKPRLSAAIAAAAMVLTLLGASGQRSATEPLKSTLLPSPSVQSLGPPPVRRKQDGCLDMRMKRFCGWDWRWRFSHVPSNVHVYEQWPLSAGFLTVNVLLSFSRWISWLPHSAPLGT